MSPDAETTVGASLAGSPHERCITACFACQQACETCAGECLSGPDMMEVMSECVRRSVDCADMCGLCGSFLARGSDLFVAVCALCAAACERCAEECQKFDQETFRRTTAACLACAEACRGVAQAPAPLG